MDNIHGMDVYCLSRSRTCRPGGPFAPCTPSRAAASPSATSPPRCRGRPRSKLANLPPLLRRRGLHAVRMRTWRARTQKYMTRSRARPSTAPHSQPPALRTARTARAPRPLWIFVRSRPSRRLPASGRGAGRGQNIRRPAAAAAAAAGLLPLLDDGRDADPHVHARPQVRPAEREKRRSSHAHESART